MLIPSAAELKCELVYLCRRSTECAFTGWGNDTAHVAYRSKNIIFISICISVLTVCFKEVTKVIISIF